MRVFTHKIADIAGGVNVATADLTQPVLHEGTPIGRDSNGLYHVVKTALLKANAANDATTYTVMKGHNFKVGDIIMAKTAGKAYAITTIATNSGNNAYDDITVGTTLGVAVSAGDELISSASNAVVKIQPNPATNQVRLTVDGVKEKLQYSIIDLNGRTLLQGQTDTDAQTVINLGDIARGTYFVKITGNGFSKVEKIVVLK